MKFIFYAVSFIAFLAAGVWLYEEPGLDSLAATTLALAALVSVYFVTQETPDGRQNQSVSGSNAVGIQAGGNVKVDSFRQDAKGKADGH